MTDFDSNNKYFLPQYLQPSFFKPRKRLPQQSSEKPIFIKLTAPVTKNHRCCRVILLPSFSEIFFPGRELSCLSDPLGYHHVFTSPRKATNKATPAFTSSVLERRDRFTAEAVVSEIICYFLSCKPTGQEGMPQEGER